MAKRGACDAARPRPPTPPTCAPCAQAEADLDEVLQTHTVFTNVSKGQEAAKVGSSLGARGCRHGPMPQCGAG